MATKKESFEENFARTRPNEYQSIKRTDFKTSFSASRPKEFASIYKAKTEKAENGTSLSTSKTERKEKTTTSVSNFPSRLRSFVSAYQSYYDRISAKNFAATGYDTRAKRDADESAAYLAKAQDDARYLRSYIKANRDSFKESELKDIEEAINNIMVSSVTGDYVYRQKKSYYDQYGSESEYNNRKKVESSNANYADVWRYAMGASDAREREQRLVSGTQRSYANAETYEKNIDFIDKRLSGLYSARDQIMQSPGYVPSARGTREFEESKKRLSDIDMEIRNLESAKAQFRNDARLATRQEKIDSYQVDPYARETVARNRDFGNPTAEELLRNDMSVMPDKSVYDRVTDSLGVYLDAKKKGFKADTLQNGGILSSIVTSGDAKNWDLLTQEEISLYYYYMNNGQQDKAKQYLSDMEYTLGRRADEQYREAYNKKGTLGKIGANLASVPKNVYGGISAFIGDTVDLVSGQEINPYDYLHQSQNEALAVRDETSKAINDKAGSLASNTYQAAMSFLDSLYGGGTLGSAYTITMGMGAASQRAKELYERGASNAQISLGSAASGAIEWLTEKLSYDKFVDLVRNQPSLAKQIIGSALGMVNEGIEEVNSDISNIVVDSLMNGLDSADERSIREIMNSTGVSYGEAKKRVIANNAVNSLWSFYGGFISGAGTAVAQSAASVYDATRVNGDVVKNALRSAVNEFKPGSEEAKVAVDLLERAEKGKSVSRKKLSETVTNAVEEKVMNMAVASIDKEIDKSALTDDEKSTAKNIGRKLVRGEELTAAESESADDLGIEVPEESQPKNRKKRRKKKKQIEENRTRRDYSIPEEDDTEISEDLKEVLDYLRTPEGKEEAKHREWYAYLIRTYLDKESVSYEDSLSDTESPSPAWLEFKQKQNESADKQANGFAQESTGKTSPYNGETASEGETIPSENKAVTDDSDAITRLVDTGEAVDINKLNDDGTVLLTNGKTTAADNIEFASDGEAAYFSRVTQDTDTRTANELLSVATPSQLKQNGVGVTAEVMLAYNAGREGVSIDTLKDMTLITPLQKQKAYTIGMNSAFREGMRNAVNTTRQTQTVQKSAKKGTVTFEHGLTDAMLSEKNRNEVSVLKRLAEATGAKIYLYASSEADRASKTDYANNGWYDAKDGSIHLDLNSGNNAEGLVLYTASHELTHFIKDWSPEKYRVLSEFIVEAYGKDENGFGLTAAELTQKQIEKAARNKQKLTYTQAFDEMIADSMETMLTDTDVLSKIEAYSKTENKGTLREVIGKIREFFSNAIKYLRDYYNGHRQTNEGMMAWKLADRMQEISDLFAEAAGDAGAKFSGVEEVIKTGGNPVDISLQTDGAFVDDGNGNSFSIRSMKSDIAEGKMFDDLVNVCGWSHSEAESLKNKLNDLVAYMEPFRKIVDMNETYGREGRRFSPFKPNSDPLYGISMDFSTLCSKRLLTQYVIEELQLRENRPMSAEEQMAIRDMLIEYGKIEKGLQVACAMCYVEAARLKSPKQINKWLNNPSDALRDYFGKKNSDFNKKVKDAQADFKERRGYKRDTPKSEMKSKDVAELNKIGPAMRKSYQLSQNEQAVIDVAKGLPASTYLTAGNLATLRETHPVIYDAYTSFVRSATRSKSLETDEPYYYGDSSRDNGNGIVVTDSFIESVNRENGMRYSSWSDWRIQHMLDYITAVIDLSVRKSAMHGYTKFPEEVRALGKTGMMFNMSGVAGTKTGLNDDGSLSFSPTESINVDEAIKLREEFPDTAGLQCIGVSDEHIVALLRSDIIDYVIPYHVSGLNKGLRTMANIQGWQDYTGTQNALKDPNAKKSTVADPEHFQIEPVFSEFFVGYDTGMNGIEAMKKSADNYIKMCKDRGLIPKFEKFAGEDNYWKLLIDRKMINQQNGNLIRQKAVQPNFDFDEMKRIVDRYVQNYDSGMESRALNHIIKNWDSIPQRIRDLKNDKSKKAKATQKAIDTVSSEMISAMPTENGKSYSTRDNRYMELAKDQEANREELQKMVDEAADEAGYTKKAYHGTLNQFTVFEKGINGIYLATNRSVAKAFSTGIHKSGSVMSLYTRFNKPFIYDATETVPASEFYPFESYRQPYYYNIRTPKEMLSDGYRTDTVSTEEIAQWAKKNGYDGVIIDNVIEGSNDLTSDYIAFSPNQVKSADLVTYDDSGNVIPLSERFNSETNDIRYQVRDRLPALEDEREFLMDQKNELVRNIAEYKEGNDEVSLKQARSEMKDVNDRLKTVNEQIAMLLDQAKYVMYEAVSYANGTESVSELLALKSQIQDQLKEEPNNQQLKDYVSVLNDRIKFARANAKAADVEATLAKQKAMEKRLTQKALYNAKTKAAVEKERAKAQVQVDKYRERIAKNRANAKRKASVARLKGAVKELRTLLLRDDIKKHVPDKMKVSVSLALDMLNLDNIDRAARMEKYMEKAFNAGGVNAGMMASDYEESDKKFAAAMEELHDAYVKFQDAKNPVVQYGYDEVIDSMIRSLYEEDGIAQKPLYEMTADEIDTVYRVYKAILTRVKNANKMLSENRANSIEEIAEKIRGQLNGRITNSPEFIEAIKKADWANLKPIYAFRRIGSDALTDMFWTLQKTEGTWATDIKEAKEFAIKQDEKYKVRSWDMDETIEYTDAEGKKFKLDLMQRLSLYAYSRRGKQAEGHLFDGGLVLGTQVKKGRVVKDYTRYVLNQEIFEEIINGTDVKQGLTDDQTAWADAMQNYLSTDMAKKGNDVSLEIYGISLFTEENYFPLKTVSEYNERISMSEQMKQDGYQKVKNLGMTKKTVPNASNPIALQGFYDVWASHVNDMSRYHADVLAFEDFDRVFNWSGKNKSVRASLMETSDNAVKYIDRLMRDLNAGMKGDNTPTFVDGLFGMYKKTNVLANLSVAIQQPTAIARAAALIDPKYFLGSIPNADKIWNERVLKYAPVAIVKDIGFFDNSVTRSTTQYLTGKTYNTFAEKAKGIITDSNYRDEILGKLPQLMDEVTWVNIWMACQRETAAKTGLSGEELYKKTGERFNEVIVMTQVYDSTLSRSQAMRSKDGFLKIITSFMAEPTTSLNMIEDAILQGRRGNKAYARRVIGGVVSSVMLNAIFKAIVQAMRDDDDDETLLEKYVGNVAGNLMDDLNILTYIPGIKDIWNIMQGYDVNRADMDVIIDLKEAWDAMSGQKTVEQKIEIMAGAIANLFGVPLRNVLRDARSFYQLIVSAMNTENTTGAGIVQSIRDNTPFLEKDSNAGQLYDAVMNGDKKQEDRVMSRYESEKKAHAALAGYMAANDETVAAAAEAKHGGKLEEYRKLLAEIEKTFTPTDTVSAINRYINAKWPEETEDKPYESDSKAAYDASEWVANYGNEDLMETVHDDFVSHSDAANPEKSWKTALNKATLEAFTTGNIDRDTAKEILTEYVLAKEPEKGETVKEQRERLEELESTVNNRLDFALYKDVYTETALTESFFGKLNQYKDKYDLDNDIAEQYASIRIDGNKDEVMAVIDSMDISKKQKDGLYFCEGYAQSTLNEAPW